MEATASLIRVLHRGVLLAETTQALRILETSHPPVYYIPPADVNRRYLIQSPSRKSFCEFKGVAIYWTVDVSAACPTADGGVTSTDAGWSYPQPSPAYSALRDYIAFYATRVDECSVDGEIVQPQPGDFYGGWITSKVSGPFKGAPGTSGW